MSRKQRWRASLTRTRASRAECPLPSALRTLSVGFFFRFSVDFSGDFTTVSHLAITKWLFHVEVKTGLQLHWAGPDRRACSWAFWFLRWKGWLVQLSNSGFGACIFSTLIFAPKKGQCLKIGILSYSPLQVVQKDQQIAVCTAEVLNSQGLAVAPEEPWIKSRCPPFFCSFSGGFSGWRWTSTTTTGELRKDTWLYSWRFRCSKQYVSGFLSDFRIIKQDLNKFLYIHFYDLFPMVRICQNWTNNFDQFCRSVSGQSSVGRPHCLHQWML